jgi:hypothetical protein
MTLMRLTGIALLQCPLDLVARTTSPDISVSVGARVVAAGKKVLQMDNRIRMCVCVCRPYNVCKVRERSPTAGGIVMYCIVLIYDKVGWMDIPFCSRVLGSLGGSGGRGDFLGFFPLGFSTVASSSTRRTKRYRYSYSNYYSGIIK